MMLQWCKGDQFNTSAWIMELVTFTPLYHHYIHSLVWNWSPLHHCIIIISIHWYWTGHLYTIVSSQYPCTGMELVTFTPLYHHNIHALVLNWSPLHHCSIIISMHWFMMIQWCKGDQFHTSAWILWCYNGVKVTSSIPVHGYYDDTMV